MQLLTRDVGIFIVLTVKIVVQFDVARDRRCTSTLACNAVYFRSSHEAEARKTERHWAYEQCKLLTRDVGIFIVLTVKIVVKFRRRD
jgi:hypothetical protein